jgi:hypothetical protein
MKPIHRLHAEHRRGGLCWGLMAKQKTPAERLAELQAQVKAAKDDMKAAERRRFEIVGAAIISLLETDADFKAAVLPKLREAVKNPRDKAAIETLLV